MFLAHLRNDTFKTTTRSKKKPRHRGDGNRGEAQTRCSEGNIYKLPELPFICPVRECGRHLLRPGDHWHHYQARRAVRRVRLTSSLPRHLSKTYRRYSRPSLWVSAMTPALFNMRGPVDQRPLTPEEQRAEITRRLLLRERDWQRRQQRKKRGKPSRATLRVRTSTVACGCVDLSGDPTNASEANSTPRGPVAIIEIHPATLDIGRTPRIVL